MVLQNCIKTTDKIFISEESALEFLIENDLIAKEKPCSRCMNSARLMIYKEKNTKQPYYRCRVKNCQKREKMASYRIRINVLINIVFLLLSDSSYKQIGRYLNVSNTLILAIKTHLRNCYKQYLIQRPILLGGPGIKVEVDESVICRRKIIRCPSLADDDIPDTVWILGGIDSSQEKNFFVKRIPNRTIDTLTRALENEIGVCSHLLTDGYPSYPGVANNLNFKHSVVNHSKGFKAPDGTHTNNIEGFWSGLKDPMRKEHGVMRDNIEVWLTEYTFKRRYLNNIDNSQFADIFKEILKLFFI